MTSEEGEKKEKGEGGLQRRASKKLGSERKGRDGAKKSVMLLGELPAGGEGQGVTVIDETEALEMERKREEEERVKQELEDERRRDEEEARRKSEEEARRKAEEK